MSPRRAAAAPDVDGDPAALAARHRGAAPGRRRQGLGAEFARLTRRFEGLYEELAARIEAAEKGGRAEEWLLDNRHVVQATLALVSESLPRGFLRVLPEVAGRPRILEVAEYLLQHLELPLEPGQLEAPLRRYQRLTLLTTGELWALPAFLRLLLLQRLACSAGTLGSPTAAAAPGAGPGESGADIAGVIVSLRALQRHDWRRFVERLSAVSAVLARDPASAFDESAFETRDSYRRAVEVLARASGRPESEVAERAIDLCLRHGAGERERHVGYFLVDRGRRQLERTLGWRPPWRQRLRDAALRRPAALYFGALALLALPPLAALGAYTLASGGSVWRAGTAAGLAVVPAVGFALALLNGLFTHLLPPRRLPRLELKEGVSQAYRTAVVMPVLLAGGDDLARCLRCLEMNFLNNTDRNLPHVLLGDFADADSASAAGDDVLLAQAERCLRALNERYCTAFGWSPFLLLHRQRRWNPCERRWIGWERKRGKLLEFNRLLTGVGDPGFSHCFGDRRLLDGVRYVLSLDADTLMPPGAARALIGVMAHPLNRAVVVGDRVVAGYGFLQPRLEADPVGAADTLFAEAFAGDRTVDLYTHAVSDVYQDLFGEGIYAGKGLYDPQVVARTLSDRLPESAVLSHDLLEGALSGAGFVSTVTCFEQYPASVLAYLRRLHRWIRGDWQLLPWLRRAVPLCDGGRARNPLSILARWQIIDNLRRSLEAPTLLLLLSLAWSGWLPGQALVWTVLLLALSAQAVWAEVLALLWQSVARPRGALRTVAAAGTGLRQRGLHWLLGLLLLPAQAGFALDAVGRTLFRLALSRRRLLEWTSAAHVQRGLGERLAVTTVWRELWLCPVFACLLATLLAALAAPGSAAASPFLVAWLLAPPLLYRCHRPRRPPAHAPNSEARRELRVLARRTWQYFQHFCGPDDHWLPPDNFQEAPRAALARRTSPTNIGLGLLSTLAAHDFGYLDLGALLARLDNSFERMEVLERYRGHLLNWYETRDLHPLEPRYVSTVDSGNLAGCLLALASGLDRLGGRPPSARPLIAGVADTLGVLEETLTGGERVAAVPAAGALLRRVRRLRSELERERSAAGERRLAVRLHEELLPGLEDQLLALLEEGGHRFSPERIGRLRQWLDELHQQGERARHHGELFEPWEPLLAAAPAACLTPSGGESASASPTADAQAQFRRLVSVLAEPVPLESLPRHLGQAAALTAALRRSLERELPAADPCQEALAWADRLRGVLEAAAVHAEAQWRQARRLAARARAWVAAMEFAFLYDGDRDLFHIGYRVSDACLDPNYYDLLASEARLAGFVAIAKGDAPSRHWLHLERPFRRLRGQTVLMSWGATLFEYLMPRLLMETPGDSLLGHACRSAITIHRRFTGRHKLPWGISESGFHHLDSHQHYQYRAFGAPGLGFRRDAGERLVVAPYACVLALPFAPGAVLENLRRLRGLGGYGQFGFYEALDFGQDPGHTTPPPRIVRSWMSHHQGMILLALANCLHDDVMVRRFHGDPRIAGLTPLLYEGQPALPPALTPWSRPEPLRRFPAGPALESWRRSPREIPAQYNVLSNGHYATVQSLRGGGGSYWQGLAVTRWRPDPTRDRDGHWHYLQDLATGEQFSLAVEPCGGVAADGVQVAPDRMEYQSRRGELFCRLRIGIGAQHDVEARHVLLKNESDRPRHLLLANYAELVLAPDAEDVRHPAFAKLFVESRHDAAEDVLLYRRRPRSKTDAAVYLAHGVLLSPGVRHRRAWDTARAAVLGRGGSAAQPSALRHGLDGFTGTAGSVLDPVIATGQEVWLGPREELEVVYLTAMGRSQREVLASLRAYRSLPRVEWLFTEARMLAEQELSALRIAPGELPWMMDLFSAVLVPEASQREVSAVDDAQLQGSLWSRGIGGDNPFLLLRIAAEGDTAFAEAVVQAHSYWCGRGMAVDLVLVAAGAGGYLQPGRDRLQQLVGEVRARSSRRLAGEVHLVAAGDTPAEDLRRLTAAARVVLDAARGSVAAQLRAGPASAPPLPPFVPARPPGALPAAMPWLPRPDDLQFDNGLGGFSADGREYVIHLDPGQRTPAPWTNVIANPAFGCLVTEAGAACTWSGNSGEHRLSGWHNDPVLDPSGETLYLRDEATAAVWTPTPAPRPADGAYQVRHGAGYSEFRHHSHGLEQTWRVFVAADAPVKLGRLTLTDRWRRPRRLTATYYVEWVMGLARSSSWPHLRNTFDADGATLLVRNAFPRDGATATAFLTASEPAHGLTTSRREFFGSDGGPEAPAALFRIGLSGEVASGGDSCAAYQVHVDLPPGATRTIYFVLGEGADAAAARALARRYREPAAAEAALAAVEAFWDTHLGSVQVETPDRAFDLLVNRWLPYQTLACRLWARTAFYQSSGAFGFRDQLQDVLAVLWQRPAWTREHLLRAAGRQFQAGDVLHWWHEAPLRGVRTRCSDDLLWLPFVAARYVEVTGDLAVLRECVPYLEGAPLERDEAERFTEYTVSGESGSLYEHCCRAIERAESRGAHGLPLIGGGDWNDGFNRVGEAGRGESVWLAWFLLRVYRDFEPLCRTMGDAALADRYGRLAAALETQVDEAGWDGAWYLRGYYDDGTPLGSAQSGECRIDLMAQTWSVLGPGRPSPRARQAMAAARRLLVREDPGQILLLAPPFDRSEQDPGYIKGYPPGIRENGGQYTHGATWALWAAAALGDADFAMRCFDLLNPIRHAEDKAGVERYVTEPYVLAGDVYGVAPHAGRGGWSWYTGASGWLYRGALEALLGLRLRGDRLLLQPCLPASWTRYRVWLRRGDCEYEIEVLREAADGEGRWDVVVDGERQSEQVLRLVSGAHRAQLCWRGAEAAVAGPERAV